jgi:hypothetical protein
MGVQLAFVKGQNSTFFVFSAKILQLFVFSLYFVGRSNFFLWKCRWLPGPNHSARIIPGDPTRCQWKRFRLTGVLGVIRTNKLLDRSNTCGRETNRQPFSAFLSHRLFVRKSILNAVSPYHNRLIGKGKPLTSRGNPTGIDATGNSPLALRD